MGLVLVDAFFEDGSEVAPEGRVVLGRLFGLALQLAQDALDHRLADLGDQRVFLQHLAADIERQVLGIDDALHEAQVGRHQTLAFVGDEHPFDVELQPVVPVGMEQVERPGRGNEQQAGVFDHAFGLEVQFEPGVVEGVGHVVVELAVLLVRDVRLGPGPERRGLVQGIAFALGLAREQNGYGDVVGIGRDHAADLRGR